MELNVEEIIRKINGTMAMSGMPLTEEDKEMLKRCIDGTSTVEYERMKLIEKYSEKEVNE